MIKIRKGRAKAKAKEKREKGKGKGLKRLKGRDFYNGKGLSKKGNKKTWKFQLGFFIEQSLSTKQTAGK
ncbi:MAG: hypothetical protein KAT04_15350 [Methylococcales bacterium]|nr:hypothetical protein [Methylococcales bacterium]